MGTPRAIKEAAGKANEFIEQQNTALATLPEDEQKLTETPSSQVDGQASDTDRSNPSTEELKSEEGKPLTEPLGNPDAKWEERYRILQGKYNAEVPRLRTESQSLQQKVSDLQKTSGGGDEMRLLQAKVQSLTEENASLRQKTAGTPPKSDVNLDEAKMREEYGDDLFEFFEQKFGTQISRVGSQVAEVNQRVEKSESDLVVDRRKADMRLRLKPKGIDFDAQNNDPMFIEFLNSYAEKGVVLRNVLSTAFSNGDMDKVEEIFLAYDEPSQQSPARSSQSPDLSQHVKLRPSSSQSDLAQQAEAWTDAEVKRFYEDKAAGRIKPEEAERLEKSLFAFLRTQ